jgi:multicomponent Na+:H+ antiporter subunit F
MPDALLAAALVVLAAVAAGMVRVLRGPGVADRIMAAQLLGTGGVAALLLIATATGAAELVDAALVLALLAGFAAVALVKAARP